VALSLGTSKPTSASSACMPRGLTLDCPRAPESSPKPHGQPRTPERDVAESPDVGHKVRISLGV
jgi:hypothetical protein